MSNSKLRNKWMRKQYANAGRNFVQSNMKDIHRNPHRDGSRNPLRLEDTVYLMVGIEE